MCPLVLFLLIPARGRRRRRRLRRKTNRRSGSQGGKQASQSIYLPILQLEKIRDQGGQSFANTESKLHNTSITSISERWLSLKNCTHLLHLKTLLRHSCNLMITCISAGIAKHPSHQQRETRGYL